jgi:hypothetical protein
LVRVIATLIVRDELKESPFDGFPDWFPIVLEAENVTVLDYPYLGMTRLGEGGVYREHTVVNRKRFRTRSSPIQQMVLPISSIRGSPVS